MGAAFLLFYGCGLRSIDDLPSLAEFTTLNDTPQQLFSHGAMKAESDFETAETGDEKTVV